MQVRELCGPSLANRRRSPKVLTAFRDSEHLEPGAAEMLAWAAKLHAPNHNPRPVTVALATSARPGKGRGRHDHGYRGSEGSLPGDRQPRRHDTASGPCNDRRGDRRDSGTPGG